MAVISVHIDKGICRVVKTDDPNLASVEVVTVVDGEAMSSRRPAFEMEILRFVGTARERSAVQIAIDAFARLATRLCDRSAPVSIDEALALWSFAKAETDRELAEAQGLVYTGGTAEPRVASPRVAAE